MFTNWPNVTGRWLDELSRLDDFFAGSPWESGIRSVAGDTWPPLNVGSRAEQVDVYLFVPGIELNNLDVTVQQNLLTITGERHPENEPERTFYRRERYSGSFQRVVTLPDDVNPDEVDATYSDGVLHVTVKRRESAKPRHIEIH